MIVRLLLLLFTAPLLAAPSMAVQELRGTLDELAYKMRGQEVELGLMMDRLNSMESRKPQASSESRLASLERSQKALASDLQMLKRSLEKSHTALSNCQKKLSQIDGLTDEIRGIKSSLKSMLALLELESSESYTVKSGDSLGQIAIDHKLSV
ncbi:MAG: LysM peptidoglycan-binding domain-containing protein, partial [Chlamydiae bacterium]|nr:LysM peptidoglycan-binding domain-containing protein [Chlamydiota bacterium]